MRSYCAETTADLSRVIIHIQQCSLFDLASLLAAGRVCDIGMHPSIRAAQRACHSLLGPTEFCSHCCPSALQPKPVPPPAAIPEPDMVLTLPLLTTGIFFPV